MSDSDVYRRQILAWPALRGSSKFSVYKFHDFPSHNISSFPCIEYLSIALRILHIHGCFPCGIYVKDVDNPSCARPLWLESLNQRHNYGRPNIQDIGLINISPCVCYRIIDQKHYSGTNIESCVYVSFIAKMVSGPRLNKELAVSCLSL